MQVVECESLEHEIWAWETAIQISVTRLAAVWMEALRIELSDRLAFEAAMKLVGELA